MTKATGALADVVVDVTAYRAALDLLASGRYPFASLPRRCVGLDDAEDLLATTTECSHLDVLAGLYVRGFQPGLPT